MLKTKTVSRLRQALFDESNNMDPELGNPYGVQPKEFKSNHENLQCDLYSRLKTAKTLKRTDISGRIRDAIPPNEIFSNTTSFNTCAIVTSAGSLHHSNLGSFIGQLHIHRPIIILANYVNLQIELFFQTVTI